MKRKTINVYKTVDVDIDIDVDVTEYTREFLEACTDDEIMKEAVSRGLLVGKESTVGAMSPYDFRRWLCDILNFGYTVSDDAILAEVKARIGGAR